MKKAGFILSLATLSALAVAQVPNFKQVKVIDLSTTVVGGSVYGDILGDVTTNGTDLFVAGFLGGATAADVGIMTITDPLNTAVITKLWSTFDVPGLNAAGGRESKLEYMVSGNGDPELFMCYGMGATHTGTIASPTNDWKDSAVVRWAFPSNQRDGTWAQLGYTANPTDITPGYLTPAEANGRPAERLDAFALDPFTTPARLAMSGHGRGLLIRSLDGNGTNAGNATNAGNFGVPNARLWRDISFKPNGDMFWKANNDIYFATRTNGSTFAVETKAVDLTDANTPMQNVWFIPASAGNYADTLIANDRSGGLNIIKVYQDSGSGWTQVGSVTGAEPISGNAQTPFASDVLGFRVATLAGKLHLLVAHGQNDGVTNGNRLHIYEVTGAQQTLTGKIIAGDFSGDYTSKTWSAKIYQGANSETVNFSTDAAGNYSIQTSFVGGVDISIRGESWLSKRFNGQTGVIPDANLLNGDIAPDEVVDLSDYTVVALYFNATSADANWNTVGSNGYAPRQADITGDGVVDLTDYTSIAVNFNAIGQP